MNDTYPDYDPAYIPPRRRPTHGDGPLTYEQYSSWRQYLLKARCNYGILDNLLFFITEGCKRESCIDEALRHLDRVYLGRSYDGDKLSVWYVMTDR